MRGLLLSLIALLVGAAAAVALGAGILMALRGGEAAPSGEPPAIVPTAVPGGSGTPVPVSSPAPTPRVPSPSPAPSSPPASPGPSPSAGFLGVGTVAPRLVVPRVGGGTLDLATYRGRPVWVNFTGTYCPPCRDEYPQMNRFAIELADEGLVVIAVHVKEPERVVADFARDLGVTFPIGLDADGSVQASWGSVVLPVHFWIDRDGVIRSTALGGLGPDAMVTGLGAILPGVPLTP